MNNYIPIDKLERRIIDISFKDKLSHIGSCLTSVGIIDKIYKVKDKKDIFILSNGHSFLALAVVLEKYEGKDAEKLAKKHGTHPNRDLKDGVHCSSGSLGQGLPIAVGMALADRTRNVWVLLSDGECAEGSIWEALRIAAENRLENLKVFVNINGYGGNGLIEVEYLEHRLKSFYPTFTMVTDMFKYPDYLNGLSGHYTVLNEDQYKEITNGHEKTI